MMCRSAWGLGRASCIPVHEPTEGGFAMIRLRAYVLVALGLLILAPTVRGQVTRTATFENFAEGQSFKPSFTDPLSGIFFHDSTGPTANFTIDSASGIFG